MYNYILVVSDISFFNSSILFSPVMKKCEIELRIQ